MKQFLLCLTLLIPLIAYGESLENVRFTVTEDDKCIVTYSLNGQGEYTVSLAVSQNGGQEFGIKPRAISGDAGQRVTAGMNKQITWDVFRDIKRLQGDVSFMVIADPTYTAAKQVNPNPESPGVKSTGEQDLHFHWYHLATVASVGILTYLIILRSRQDIEQRYK